MKKKSLSKLQLSKKQIANMNPTANTGGYGSYSHCWSVNVCWQANPGQENDGPVGNLCGGGWW